MGSSPRDLAGLLALHPYIMTNLNIPSDALNNVPTWIFFKDTIKVNELNEWLQRYIAWCEEVHSALIERRRALA